MRFEVLPGVNVKTFLIGYEVMYGRDLRTCLRNLLPPTSGLMTRERCPVRNVCIRTEMA